MRRMKFKNFIAVLVALSSVYQAAADSAFFTCPNSKGARLELEVGYQAQTIFVPLSRKNADAPGNNILRCADATVAVDWTVGETSKVVEIAIPMGLRKGRKIPLELYNNTQLCDESEIYIVSQQKNDVHNPYWIGERAAETLEYGEWTMDYDVALEKVRTEGGFLMATFSGQLWCPNCTIIENSLFANSSFKKWAKGNKVVLVLFDQPRFGLTAPQLLSYENDPRITDDRKAVSGASYLSRKNISLEEAEAVKERAYTLSYETWLHAASSATATRLSNPTVLFIDNEGHVATRFDGLIKGKRYPIKENLALLDEALFIANGYKTDKPTLEASQYELTLYSTFSAEGILNEVLVNAIGTSHKLKKTSGKLPSGLTLKIDKEARAVYSSGVAKKVGTYEASYAFSERREAQTVTGPAIHFTAHVLDPMLFNAHLGKTIKAKVPLYDSQSNEIGLVSISISKSNKITAKVTGVTKRSLTFRGYWQDIIDGDVITTLVARTGEQLYLTLTKTGEVVAEFGDHE